MPGEQRTTDATERILQLATYLDRSRAGVSLEQISRDVPGYRPEVSAGSPAWEAVRKRVRRDLDDLRDHWGIEINVAADGIYTLRPPFFSPDERAALIAAAGLVEVDGLHDGRPGEIGSAIDDTTAEVVVGVHDLVALLRDACANRTPVRFRYGDAVRTLWPYGLGTWHNRWYVAGWDPDRDAIRRFRLDRIDRTDDRAIETAGRPDTYDIPEWFDPEIAFDFDPNLWGRDPLLRARVRVDTDHLAAFAREFNATVIAEHDGAADLEFDVRHYQSTRDRLLGFGAHAVVLAPPELVAMMRDHLAAVGGIF